MANTGNTQQQINYGSAANDGQGDPLRTAFIKTDDNFDAIWNAGPVGSNITVVNNTVQANNVNGNLVLRPNGVGVIQANATILPNATNLRDLGSTGQRFRAAYIGTGGLSVDGNVTVTGNLTAGNISYTGNVFVGDLRGSVYADDSTIMVDAVDNTMFADTATFGTTNVSGNVTANYYIGNGSLLTGVASSYGNADVAAFLATYNGNIGEANIRVGRISTGSVRSADAVIGNLWFIDSSAIVAPAGGSWLSRPDLSTEFINSPANGFINLVAYNLGNLATELYMEHGFVRIRVDNGGPEQDWNFRVDGTLQVPGDIIPQSNGTASLGNATNYWSNLWVANNTIYIGGVPLGISAGNVLTVNGEAVLSNNSNSSITTTGNLAAGNILTDNYRYANGDPFVSSSTGNITFSNTTMSPPDGEDLIITSANAEVQITGLDFRVETTDDVRITGNDTVSIRNTSETEPITIVTDYNGAERTWEFGADGTLRTPGDIVMSGDITGTDTASTLVLRAEPDSYTYIQLNNLVDSTISAAANLEIRTDVPGTEKTWTFDTTGDLTAPGNISGTNFIISESLIASGASPAPTISGFSTADFSGNVTAGNVSTTGLVDSYDINAANSITVGNDLSVTGDISGAYVSATGNIAGGNLIVTGTVYGQVANVVTGFETAGYVTATGNITGANFIVSESLIGSGASPAPTLSGFSTISATGNINGGNLVTTGNVVGNTAGFAIGYRDIPQVSFTGNATTAAADAGKHFYSTESTDYILTIADNSAVSWPVGTAITVVNRGTGNITVAQAAGVSLYLAGNSSAGNRTVSTYGMATVLNVAANVWMINGTGVS